MCFSFPFVALHDSLSQQRLLHSPRRLQQAPQTQRHIRIFAGIFCGAIQLHTRKADLAAATQAAIVEVLVKKSLLALKDTGLKRLVVAGGVGANSKLREQLNAVCARRGIRVHYPELALCTDNGAMIAMAAALRLQAGMAQTQSDYGFDVRPRWPLEELSERIPI